MSDTKHIADGKDLNTLFTSVVEKDLKKSKAKVQENSKSNADSEYFNF